MTFWKISDTRMNCLISLAEIEELGYTLEELMHDRDRTQEFLNLLLEKGQEVLGMQMENGIQSFYGAFLPDKSLLVSIAGSRQEAHPELPFDAVDAEGPILTYQLIFPMLDNVLQFCNIFGTERASGSRLYEDDDLYYLMVDFPNTEEGRKKALSVISAGEFGGLVEKDAISEFFLQEHDETLIADHAIEKLCKIEKGGLSE